MNHQLPARADLAALLCRMAEAVPIQEGSTVQLLDMSAAADRALDLALESCANRISKRRTSLWSA